MSHAEPLVSIGLPVRNAGAAVVDVARSVLAQDYEHLELVISDNASTDETQDVCRELARSDSRIVYRRQAENIGMINNFAHTIRVATGTYFRWIGDDDRLEPTFVSRCLETFRADPRLILVTTAIAYSGADGPPQLAVPEGTALSSDDPADRFAELLRLLNEGHLLIDPLYGMVLREPVAAIPRPNMRREDEVFAAKLALAGPWGHVPEVLAHRALRDEKVSTLVRRLGLPARRAHFANTLMHREILRWLRTVDLTDEQRRRARSATIRSYRRRIRQTVRHRSHRLMRMVLDH